MNIKRNYKYEKIRNKILVAILRSLLIIGLSFIILFPIIKAVIASITSYDYLGVANSQWIPWKTSGEAYVIANKMLKYPTAIWRTLIYALVIMVIQVTIAAIAGYGLHIMKFKGSKLFFIPVLITIIIPAPIIALPQYIFLHSIKIFGKDGLVGKEIAIYIIAIFGQGIKQGLFIYLFRQFYKGLPKELTEAATMDGCSFVGTFIKIILPNSKTIIITVCVFSFIWNYGDTFYTGYFARNANLLPNNLSNINLNTAQIAFNDLKGIPNMNRYYLPSITGAANILFIAPVLLLYFIIQKSFVQNFENSGIVG